MKVIDITLILEGDRVVRRMQEMCEPHIMPVYPFEKDWDQLKMGYRKGDVSQDTLREFIDVLSGLTPYGLTYLFIDHALDGKTLLSKDRE